MAEELSKKDAIISALIKEELAQAKSSDDLQGLRTERDELKIRLGIQVGRAEEFQKMLETAKVEAEKAFMKGLESGAIVDCCVQDAGLGDCADIARALQVDGLAEVRSSPHYRVKHGFAAGQAPGAWRTRLIYGDGEQRTLREDGTGRERPWPPGSAQERRHAHHPPGARRELPAPRPHRAHTQPRCRTCRWVGQERQHDVAV
eukprot:scaffold19441_cov129-Isochrysis_galbana.AAC.3